MYGKDTQAPTPTDDSPLLDDASKNRIRQVIGKLLYCAQAINPTILMTLSNITTQQAAPTENTRKQVEQLLDYCGHKI
jgi:hypothetical protein